MWILSVRELIQARIKIKITDWTYVIGKVLQTNRIRTTGQSFRHLHCIVMIKKRIRTLKYNIFFSIIELLNWCPFVCRTRSCNASCWQRSNYIDLIFIFGELIENKYKYKMYIKWVLRYLISIRFEFHRHVLTL